MKTNPAPETPGQPNWIDLQRIVSEQEAAQLRGISVDTLRRQVDRGEGPTRVRLSPRRIGYRLGEVLNLEAR
jgi:predicted DNA-binding transcriptional regulator AlpA